MASAASAAWASGGGEPRELRHELRAAVAHRGGERRGVIGEEPPRLGGAVLLALEQERHLGAEQQQRGQRAQRRRDRSARCSRSPNAELATWSWFSRKWTNRVGARRRGSGVPRGLLLPRIQLALVQEAALDRRHELLRRCRGSRAGRPRCSPVSGDHARRGGSRRSTARRGRAALRRRPHAAGRPAARSRRPRRSCGRAPAASRDRRAIAAEHVLGRAVVDRLGRVEPQAVEVELVDPVARRWRARARAPGRSPGRRS